MSGMLQRRDRVALALSPRSGSVSWLPEQERIEIIQLRARIAGLRRAVQWRYEMLKTPASIRGFAEQAERTPYPELLLSMNEGKGIDEAISQYGLEKLADLLGLT
jgi:hypothetical protein